MAERESEQAEHRHEESVWQDPEHVRRFAETIDARTGEREPLFRLMAALLPYPSDQPIRVLDLGSGLGTAAAAVLAAFPNAHGVGLERSEEMIRRGMERMAGFGERFRYAAGDFSAGLPASVEGDFDAIVSAAAIHHLPAEQKPQLYASCRPRLKPGGALFNLDYVQPPDHYVLSRYQAVWEAEDAGRGIESADGSHAPPRHYSGGLLEEHLAWLRDAGFVSVDCFAKRLNLALIGGFRR